jgi:diguanylate cyclase (GGDEF)-like protein
MYYTVTKAEGPMILEINHKPALSFMDELLGGEIQPEQYPFFLLFGINYGERWGEYDENKYASRLCFGIDRESDGIIMFEPDMVEGTEFQIMYRSFELDYMKPKIESLFENLNGRKPVFAMYINCAGRCAGYSGTDMEDALILQQTIAGRVPVLGIYSGVEIASVAGRPRGLDWTGVLCLFSQNSDSMQQNDESFESKINFNKNDESTQNTPLEIANKLCMQNAAKILKLDAQAISLRYELELKRRGFRLISELAVSLRQTTDYKKMFVHVAKKVNAALNMQKTLVLLSDDKKMFSPLVLQGFSAEEKESLDGLSIKLPEELLTRPVVVTSEDSPSYFEDLRKIYNLPYFVASPIYQQGEVAALMITGRLVEQEPYLRRLVQSDIETVHSITELLGSVLTRLQLHNITYQAKTDGLTKLWNRMTFQHMVEDYLSFSKDNHGAFMMIDMDYFKSINDTFGHIIGDSVIKSCAAAMKKVLRDTDIIGRQGGDEFVVFCRGIKNKSEAQKKAEQIQNAWKNIIPKGSKKYITASIGISLFPYDGITFHELYKNADIALYKAKEQGRNCSVLFSKKNFNFAAEKLEKTA